MVTDTPTVTTAQAAALLGITTSNVRQLAQRGKLTRLGRRGRMRVYPLEDVQKLRTTHRHENTTNMTSNHYDDQSWTQQPNSPSA
jgi:DNA-binding transcriptional MerR regulator